jgi:hypothetical protein
MHIFVDADAFPNLLKEILLKAVLKRGILTSFVANKPIFLPPSPFLEMIVVAQGADEADHYIVSHTQQSDLVITADIPLADRLVKQNVFVLEPRGTIFDENNIRSLLVMRNLMQELRDAGEITSGPAPIGEKQKRAFADALNALLQKHFKPRP